MIAIVHHPDYVAPAPARSTYQWNKNGLIRDLLRNEGERIDWHEPQASPVEWLEAVHDPDYVAEVLEERLPPEKTRRIGFPVTAQVARRSQAVAGGTYLAARIAMAQGFAANSAGGSHHALHSTGAGYCVFNDLAVAAHRIAEERVAERILIVDCDVHQGDGTASLLAGRSDIATYSIHAEKNFPARKAQSTLDIALPDGTGDDAYLAALSDSLTPMIDMFAPDLILYQAGVDPFAGDRLGRLSLTLDGLVRRDRWIAHAAIARRVPLASVVGGGYGIDALEVARRHVATILTLGSAFEKHWLQGERGFLPLGRSGRGVEIPTITKT